MNSYTKIGNIPTDKCDKCPLIAYCGDSYEEPHLCCDTSISEMTVQQYIQAAQAIPYENIATVAEKEDLTIAFSREGLSEEEQEDLEGECDNNIKKIVYEIIAKKNPFH